LLAEVQQLEESFDTMLFKQYKEAVDLKTTLDTQLDRIKLTIKNKLEKLDKLKEHEYDPDCKYCTSNVFVQDAINTRADLEKDKQSVSNFLQDRQRTVDFIEQNKSVGEEALFLNNKKAELNKAVIDRSAAETAYERITNQLDQGNQALAKVKADIELYTRNTGILENNKRIQDEISTINKQKNVKSIEVSKLNNVVKDFHAKIEVAKKTINESIKTIEHMKELEEQQVAYELYCKAMYKDGIPYNLISRAVPYIQQHTNNILNQIIDFTVELETDGKNINAFICYDDDRWPLEMSSGMERFLSSIAIRIALIRITNLPKPDFIAIDEGLGVLDSSNLNSMHTLFTHMKDIFRFSLVISHIDVVRDMVDNVLSIDKKGDFSYISC
jgi:DNA repair exonuclease SbcCD ATPase subunit